MSHRNVSYRVFHIIRDPNYEINYLISQTACPTVPFRSDPPGANIEPFERYHILGSDRRVFWVDKSPSREPFPFHLSSLFRSFLYLINFEFDRTLRSKDDQYQTRSSFAFCLDRKLCPVPSDSTARSSSGNWLEMDL